MRSTAFLTAVASCLLTSPLTAETSPSSPNCGDAVENWLDPAQALLEGEWGIEMGAGTLQFGNQFIPLPPGDIGFATFSFVGDQLYISGGPVPEGEAEVRAWREGLNFDLPENAAVPTSHVPQNQDIAEAAGCDVNELPQLQASGVYQDSEGEVVFNAFFTVITDFWIIGATVGALNGDQGVARRVFEMRR